MPHLNDLKLRGTDELNIIAIEIVRLIETITMPILTIDSSGFINGWNANVAELTRLPIGEVMGQSLVKGLILEDFVKVVECLLYLALQGMVLISYGIQFISSCSHM
jgi:phytochrome B